MRFSVFLVSFYAYRVEQGKHIVKKGIAYLGCNAEESEEIGLDMAKAEYPKEKGWLNHGVEILECPQPIYLPNIVVKGINDKVENER